MTLQLDHVAIGTQDANPVIGRLVGELGGTIIGGGVPPGSGFRAVQIHLGSPDDVGMTVEVLEPHEPQHNDFLQRFVDSRGAGPHHVTFKTPDIRAEIDRFTNLGIEPIGVRIDNPRWREFFVHPKRAHGVVVQVAQSSHHHPPMPERLAGARRGEAELHQWWADPPPRGRWPARLRRWVMTSTDVPVAVEFWVEVLGGRASGTSVTWPGGQLSIEPGAVDEVVRYELEGLTEATEIGGSRFVPASQP